MRARLCVVLVVGALSAGCSGGSPPPGGPVPLTALVSADDRVSEVINAALEADARLDPADSLYQPDADVVANGTRRFVPPRFAGVEPGGAVAVASARIELRAGLAWATVEYRWMSTVEGRASEGRATVILTPGDAGGWRIRHAHSSSAE